MVQPNATVLLLQDNEPHPSMTRIKVSGGDRVGRKISVRSVLVTATSLPIALVTTPVIAQPGTWAIDVIVNNGDVIPGTGSVFNAYNQPSINEEGLVVFRARGRGGGWRAATHGNLYAPGRNPPHPPGLDSAPRQEGRNPPNAEQQ